MACAWLVVLSSAVVVFAQASPVDDTVSVEEKPVAIETAAALVSVSRLGQQKPVQDLIASSSLPADVALVRVLQEKDTERVLNALMQLHYDLLDIRAKL